MNKFDKSERENDDVTRCYLLSGIAKLHSVKEYITTILENSVKIIIFAHHKVVMEAL